MNTTAISVLAEAGIQGRDAEILLRRLLSALIDPRAAALRAIEGLGLTVGALDPSTRSIAQIVRRLADARLEEAAAREIFGEDAAPAALILTSRVERLEALQGS